MQHYNFKSYLLWLLSIALVELYYSLESTKEHYFKFDIFFDLNL